MIFTRAYGYERPIGKERDVRKKGNNDELLRRVYHESHGLEGYEISVRSNREDPSTQISAAS